MSNVKAGDFARIECTLAGSDNGKVVHVEGVADCGNLPLKALLLWGTLWWDCTLMSVMKLGRLPQSADEMVEFHIKAPGFVTKIPDIHLRRIDPPEEPDEDENEQEHEEQQEVKA